jgi:nucleoside-diphosphate-sugar epimerase
MAAIALAVERQLRLTLLRPFHVFGEGEHPNRFWPSLRLAALAGADYPMTGGRQVRDFTPVEAVAQAFLQAVGETPLRGRPEIRNLGTGQPQALGEFADLWWRQWGAKGRLRVGELPYRPNEVMRYVPKLCPLG